MKVEYDQVLSNCHPPQMIKLMKEVLKKVKVEYDQVLSNRHPPQMIKLMKEVLRLRCSNTAFFFLATSTLQLFADHEPTFTVTVFEILRLLSAGVNWCNQLQQSIALLKDLVIAS